MTQIRPSAPRTHVPTPSVTCSVFIDGSALFLGSRSFYEGRQLNYNALTDLLVSKIAGLRPPSAECRWVMWTASSPQNVGQTRFLDFAEQELKWSVRRFNPADSFMVEPAAVVGLSSDKAAASRLVRFDASIAFAIGRLADHSKVVVVSDSFALAEPLRLTARIGKKNGVRPVLSFFGRGLDSRWQGVLRKEGDFAPEFLDLDDFEEALFGSTTPTPAKRPESRDDLIF